MALRKGRCFTKPKISYTKKSKVKSKSYIKTIPSLKIARFNMGDSSGFKTGKYRWAIYLVINNFIRIRDNAIEAARQTINRYLDKNIKENYFFRVSAYPHEILREHKMLTGAGADRIQSGMTHSFGKPIGVAARLSPGDKLFSIFTIKENINTVRDALEKIKAKLPGKKSIVVEHLSVL